MNGAIPNVPNEKAQRCQTALGIVTFGQLGLPTLDGSRSQCEWGEAAGSADKGLLPNAGRPRCSGATTSPTATTATG